MLSFRTSFKLLNLFLIIIIFYIVKRNFFPSSIIYVEFFYFNLSIFIIYFFYYFFFKKRNFLYFIKNKILNFLLIFFINYSILMTFIVNGDRSPSMHILNTINNGSGVNYLNIKTSLNENFFEKKGQLKKRINEQLHLKNVIISENKYYITNKGERTIKLFVVIKNLFNIQ